MVKKKRIAKNKENAETLFLKQENKIRLFIKSAIICIIVAYYGSQFFRVTLWDEEGGATYIRYEGYEFFKTKIILLVICLLSSQSTQNSISSPILFASSNFKVVSLQ